MRQSGPSYFLVEKPASTLLVFRLFPLAGAGMRRLGLGGGSTDEVRYEVLNTKCGAWAWGRGERSPSSLLAAAGKQGNDSLKANHYLRVILCCALRARYH